MKERLKLRAELQAGQWGRNPNYQLEIQPDNDQRALASRRRRRVGQYLGSICLTLSLAGCYQESDPEPLAAISTELELVSTPPAATEVPATEPPASETQPEQSADAPIGSVGEELPEVDSELALEVGTLARQLGLTAKGQQILDQLSLQITDDEAEIRAICGDGEEVIGCFSHNWLVDEPGKIVLLRSEHNGANLAHELLHAIYKHLFYKTEINWIQDFNQLLRETIEGQYPELGQRIRDYYNPQGYDNLGSQVSLLTEYYAYLATMAPELPPKLEAHYTEYFVDRQTIVDLETTHGESLGEKRAARADWPEYRAIQIQEWHDCLATGQPETDCQDYQPNEAAYQAYDDCLASSPSTAAGCRQLNPDLIYFDNPAGIGAFAEETESDQP